MGPVEMKIKIVEFIRRCLWKTVNLTAKTLSTRQSNALSFAGSRLTLCPHLNFTYYVTFGCKTEH